MAGAETVRDLNTLPTWERIEAARKNRLINTDTYNRTMNHLRGPEGWRAQETYVLQMRRAPAGYLVAAGIEDAVGELVTRPITQEELDEAAAFYEERQVPFNKAMWQEVIDEHDGRLPFEIYGAADGTVILPGEPMLRVTGPGELIAHFEPYFHRPFYPTMVATRARMIKEIIGDPDRFIEVGKRGTPDERSHLTATKAMYIGGGIRYTCNDAAAMAFPELEVAGTIGHRYVQRFPSVEAAFRHAIENLDAVSLLVDLVESYQGIDLALQLKKEYRETGKKIWIRVDSGDVAKQTVYFLNKCDQLGFTDPLLDRIIVEGIDDITDIADIEARIHEDQRPRVRYGAGGLLIAQGTTRSDASTGFKLSEYEDGQGNLVPTHKFSDSPGKQSFPGKPTLVYVEGERKIAQVGEYPNADEVLKPLYQNGDFMPITSSLNEGRARCERQYADHLAIKEADILERLSPETLRKMGEVAARYGIAPPVEV